MNYEAERKFLLKKLPELNLDKPSNIKQFYFKDEDYRLRVETLINNDKIYTKTVKKPTGNIGFEEDEVELNHIEYK